MDWLETTIRTTTSGAEIISEVLINVGCAGTSIEDRNDVQLHQRPEGQWDIIDEDIIEKMDKDVLVKGYFQIDERLSDTLSTLREHLDQLKQTDLGDIDLGKATIETSTINETDWADCWKQYYKPFKAGEHFIVKPSWEDYQTLPSDKIIEMDPGMAFGTGTHETTLLCLEFIESCVKPGMTVLDIGSGTGILSIGAALCGAESVAAIDIDPMAVRITKENAIRNKVGDKVKAFEGNLLDKTNNSISDITPDLIVANIISDAIIILAPSARAIMREEGILIASGIIRERELEVSEALEAAGFKIVEIRHMGSWVAIKSLAKQQ